MSTENLRNEEAVDKLKELASGIDIGMLCTHTADSKHVHAVPMSTQEVDEFGNIWFLFSSESNSYTHLQDDRSVCLLYSSPSDYKFLSVHGETMISTDQSRIDKYWNVAMEGWFEKGKEDHRIRVLKVMPIEAHYWDTESNKLITFLKATISGISGQKMDIGRSGNLDI